MGATGLAHGSAPVGPARDVLGEHRGQAVQVAVPRRVEEALEQAGVLLVGRREPVVAAGEVGMGPVVGLPAGRGGQADGLRDLLVGQLEGRTQHEHGPLRRGEPLHQVHGGEAERASRSSTVSSGPSASVATGSGSHGPT